VARAKISGACKNQWRVQKSVARAKAMARAKQWRVQSKRATFVARGDQNLGAR
jgi:hypothetical protein